MSALSTSSLPFPLPSYVRIFPSLSQLCRVLTADLTPYGNSSVNRHLQEKCCMTACVSKSPSEMLRRVKGTVGDEWNVCLRDRRQAVIRISQRKQSQWGMKEAYRSRVWWRESCLLIHCYHRNEGQHVWDGMWKNTPAVRWGGMLRVFFFLLYFVTEYLEVQPSTPLPVGLSRHKQVKCICISSSQIASPWIEIDLWDVVSGGHVVHKTTISSFGAITIVMTCFVHWLITMGEEGNSLHQLESPSYMFTWEMYDNSCDPLQTKEPLTHPFAAKYTKHFQIKRKHNVLQKTNNMSHMHPVNRSFLVYCGWHNGSLGSLCTNENLRWCTLGVNI